MENEIEYGMEYSNEISDSPMLDLSPEMALGLFIGITVIMLILCILMIISLWKIYEKAGEPGWASLVPLYREYILFEMTWDNGWLFLLTLIPVLGFFVLVITYYKLSQVFNCGAGMFCLLLFIPMVAYLMLAFGQAEYDFSLLSGKEEK